MRTTIDLPRVAAEPKYEWGKLDAHVKAYEDRANSTLSLSMPAMNAYLILVGSLVNAGRWMLARELLDASPDAQHHAKQYRAMHADRLVGLDLAVVAAIYARDMGGK